MDHINKIIIMSEDEDYTTYVVIMWLRKMGILNVKRINVNDSSLSITIKENIVKVLTSYDSFEILKNDLCWFRRAVFPAMMIQSDPRSNSGQRKFFSYQEKKNIFESLLCWIINNCRYYSNPFCSDVNKIDVLIKAKECGLQVPDWLLTGEREEAKRIIEKHTTVAVKPFNPLSFIAGDFAFKNITKLIKVEDIERIPDVFRPFIFQKYIHKKYELRIFFFKEYYYSMLIDSQNDSKTSTDFRNYNNDMPNRFIPYQIPDEYKKKLKHLSEILKLDTGSYDVLVDKNDEYYFLEVNPIGQFGMVSYPCNYFIEKYIAEYLYNQLNKI